MTGFKVVNLKLAVEEIGEERIKGILSNFSCPMNKDVESFLRYKSIEFSKQGLSQTHLVMASYKGNPEIVGYFCLANKYITVQGTKISGTLRRRVNKFSVYDSKTKS